MPSTNKAKKPQDHKKASKKSYGSGWKSPLRDLELPSGESCQVRRVGVQALIKAGVLHSLDTLTSLVVSETIPKAEGKPTLTGAEIVNDPEKFDNIMSVVDKIVGYVVTQPELVSDHDDEGNFIPYEDRDADLVYIDYVDEQDKMFIMNFAVGGTADLQQFRQESQALVGGVSAGEAAESETE